ncbi:MAG: hypothetical protein ABR964_08630 [Tepidisphaeraceae bacterium]|jgi:hypothetical protein
MFLIHNGKVVCDWDLEFLGELLALIDKQLDKLYRQAKQSADPDSFGIFDSAEGVIGLGFVACQRYLVATCGSVRIDKKLALVRGARHPSGMTIPEIINHAANYWKHRDEWQLDKSPANQNRVRRIWKAFKAVGCAPDLNYPLSCILAKLVAPGPPGFKPIITKLERWRDELRAAVRRR